MLARDAARDGVAPENWPWKEWVKSEMRDGS
jgi:hypothetical protein